MTDTPDDRPEYLRRLFPRPANGQRANGYTPTPLPVGEANRYVAKALADEVAALAEATPGHRNDQLNVSGFNLAQLVAGGYLNRDDAWNALHTTALGIGLTEAETIGTLRSAFGAGEASPRVVADLDATEPPPVTAYTAPAAAAQAAATTDDALSIGERFPALDWHALWADDTEDDWVLEPLLPARRLVALFSPPKVGKSLLMLEVAVAVARGGTALSRPVERARRVLYVDFENDPRGDIRSRLQAMHVGPDDLGNLLYLSYPRLAYLDTAIGGYELLAVCKHYDVEVVVIDTISRAVSGEENDNDTWLGFYRNTGLLLKDAGIATIRLDHTGKDATKGMRGGSAKYGDVDAVWSLTRLSEQAYQLECTDNRLPIAEKVLVVRREYNPLRHVVDTAGRKAVEEEGIAAALAAIDALDPPHPVGTGYPTLWPLIRHHPLVSKAVAKKAIARRNTAPATYQPPLGD